MDSLHFISNGENHCPRIPRVLYKAEVFKSSPLILNEGLRYCHIINPPLKT